VGYRFFRSVAVAGRSTYCIMGSAIWALGGVSVALGQFSSEAGISPPNANWCPALSFGPSYKRTAASISSRVRQFDLSVLPSAQAGTYEQATDIHFRHLANPLTGWWQHDATSHCRAAICRIWAHCSVTLRPGIEALERSACQNSHPSHPWFQGRSQNHFPSATHQAAPPYSSLLLKLHSG